MQIQKKSRNKNYYKTRIATELWSGEVYRKYVNISVVGFHGLTRISPKIPFNSILPLF